MQLESLRVQHFRSLYDTGWIPFHDLTILIGENDGGKTATLDALEVLLSNRSPASEDYSYVPGCKPDANGNLPREEEIIVEAHFLVGGPECVEVGRYAPLSGDHLHVRKRFTNDGGTGHSVVGPVPADERLRVDLDSLRIQDLRSLVADLGLTIRGTTKQPFIDAIRVYRAEQPMITGTLPMPSATRPLLPGFVIYKVRLYLSTTRRMTLCQSYGKRAT